MVFLSNKRYFIPRLAVALMCAASVVHAAKISEYDLKAALLIKVAAFVSWPKAEEASTEKEGQHEEICIGILGDDPFGATLDGLLQQARTESRVSTVRRLEGDVQISECQVVFVSASRQESARDVFSKAANAQVLTVGDFAGFVEAGGMVELKLEDNRIALRINAKAVEAAGLTISSKLLSLAEIVETLPESAER